MLSAFIKITSNAEKFNKNQEFLSYPCPSPPMVLNVKNDIEIVPGATDGISDIAFSPAADFIAASSWDGQV